MFKKKPSKQTVSDKEAVDAMMQIRTLVAEHFDCGVVLMTREIEGRTEYYNTEVGNKFAVKGMVDSYQTGEMENGTDEEDTD